MSGARTIFLTDPENGFAFDNEIATVTPAAPEDVQTVLNAAEGDGDGRSAFQWIRLQNGDLILGVFPQGDTYEIIQQKVNP